jgi:hypothetical protein
MHFGKRLAAFNAEHKSWRCLDYKSLKRIIKNSEFDAFFAALSFEINSLASTIHGVLSEIELEAARCQLDLIRCRLLFAQSELQNYRGIIHLDTCVSDRKFAHDLATVISSSLSPVQATCLVEFVEKLNHFSIFLDMNACGLRKIVKKFSKRSNQLETPVFNQIFPMLSIGKLREVADLMLLFGAPAISPLGPELSTLI